MCMCVTARSRLCVCVCVCVWERERESDRQRERERETAKCDFELWYTEILDYLSICCRWRIMYNSFLHKVYNPSLEYNTVPGQSFPYFVSMIHWVLFFDIPLSECGLSLPFLISCFYNWHIWLVLINGFNINLLTSFLFKLEHGTFFQS